MERTTLTSCLQAAVKKFNTNFANMWMFFFPKRIAPRSLIYEKVNAPQVDKPMFKELLVVKFRPLFYSALVNPSIISQPFKLFRVV
jgi:hypothetical protein